MKDFLFTFVILFVCLGCTEKNMPNSNDYACRLLVSRDLFNPTFLMSISDYGTICTDAGHICSDSLYHTIINNGNLNIDCKFFFKPDLPVEDKISNSDLLDWGLSENEVEKIDRFHDSIIIHAKNKKTYKIVKSQCQIPHYKVQKLNESSYAKIVSLINVIYNNYPSINDYTVSWCFDCDFYILLIKDKQYIFTDWPNEDIANLSMEIIKNSPIDVVTFHNNLTEEYQSTDNLRIKNTIKDRKNLLEQLNETK